MRLKQRRAHRRRISPRVHSIDQSGLRGDICQRTRLLLVGLGEDVELGADFLHFLFLLVDTLKKHFELTLQFFRNRLFTTV